MIPAFVGVGGQIDFLRGAALCHDGLGKPILAMPSVTKRGESKIVPFIKEGKCTEKLNDLNVTKELLMLILGTPCM